MRRYQSPAKINLFLHILHKREDGYHEIASLFQAVNIYDYISFELAEYDSFTSTHPTLPLDKTNLIIKAVNLFKKKIDRSFSLKIHLEKNIPMQAGLGGGSSNAATTLFALNQLFKTPFSEEELSFLGAELGSDVPFFFSSGRALCTGRGEKVTNCKPEAFFTPITLVTSPIGLSTPLVYKTYATAKAEGNNHLEASAFTLAPELAKLKQNLLEQGCIEVFMTGSGSGLIAIGKIPTVTYPTTCYPLSFLYRKEKSWIWEETKIRS